MGLTPNYEIPYPELPDPADVPFYSKAQAEKVDEILADAVLARGPDGLDRHHDRAERPGRLHVLRRLARA